MKNTLKTGLKLIGLLMAFSGVLQVHAAAVELKGADAVAQDNDQKCLICYEAFTVERPNVVTEKCPGSAVLHRVCCNCMINIMKRDAEDPSVRHLLCPFCRSYTPQQLASIEENVSKTAKGRKAIRDMRQAQDYFNLPDRMAILTTLGAVIGLAYGVVRRRPMRSQALRDVVYVGAGLGVTAGILNETYKKITSWLFG
jgi:hypothetical protein